MEILGWAVLGLLLLGTLIGALTLDRSKLPLLGDEATYAMQAASLAWDFDLAYTRVDYDRFVHHWGMPPEGLILQSRPGSDRLVYGKPPLYAVVLAPFVHVAPVRGPVIANALLLAAASLLAAAALRRRIGAAAPLWVAAFVFASVAFAYVFWGDADLFLMAAVAAGFALVYWGDRRYSGAEDDMPQVYQGEDVQPARGFLFRWLGAGALLGIAVVFRPPYLALALPAVLAAWSTVTRRRWAATAGLVLGLVATPLLSMGLQALAGGDPTGYGGQRQGIYARESFPEVDFPAAQWSERVQKEGNASWIQRDAVKPIVDPPVLGAWNLLYFLVGRNVGVLPYFLPLVLGFIAFQRDRGRWAILLAVAVVALFFLFVRPFNFHGGGPLGNRYFLPLYPALWFLAARPSRPVLALIVAALASPFLSSLWTHPTAYPIQEDGQPAHVTALAQRFLPYETTQASAPGQEVGVGGGLWVKLLNHNVWTTGRAGALRVAGASEARLLVGSPQPLDSLHFEFNDQAPSRLIVGGEELRPFLLKPDGYVIFEIPLLEPRAVHPLWWTPYNYHLYEIDFRLPGAPSRPIGLHILPPRDLIQRR
jgi:Glycosyltransferase family 87